MPKSPKRKAPPVSRVAYTVPEFCAAYGISRSFYYRLRDEGRGPREMRLSKRRVLISHEAAAAWARARES